MNDIDFNEYHDKFVKRWELEHNIWCPHCNHKVSIDSMYNHISYHGDDGEKKHTCGECDKDFMVKEIVDRTWETHKMGDE